jgi:hypothetical protein
VRFPRGTIGSELGQDHGRFGRTWKVSLMVWRCKSRKRDSSPPPAAFFARPPFFDIEAAVAVAGRGWEGRGRREWRGGGDGDKRRRERPRKGLCG